MISSTASLVTKYRICRPLATRFLISVDEMSTQRVTTGNSSLSVRRDGARNVLERGRRHTTNRTSARSSSLRCQVCSSGMLSSPMR